MCVLEACPTSNFSAPTFSDHLTIAPIGSAAAGAAAAGPLFLQCALCEVGQGASATFKSSKSAQSKLYTSTIQDTRSTRETRKCPEVQSFAVNADEPGIHGGREYVSGQALSASRVVAALCRLHPFPFLCRPPGPDWPASLLCTSSTKQPARLTLQQTLQQTQCSASLIHLC